MFTSNQNDSGNLSKLNFTPIYSRVSSMGTTVTYGAQSMNQVNAMNAGVPVSGSFATNTGTGWTQLPYGTSYGTYPVINAGVTNQYASGNFGYAGGSYGLFQQQFGQTILAQPSVDISETTSDVCVAAYIPSVTLNDISLSVTDNSVTISAAAWTGSQSIAFNRTIALPTSIRADAVDASMQSGILEIRLPKAEKTTRKRNTVSQDAINTK